MPKNYLATDWLKSYAYTAAWQEERPAFGNKLKLIYMLPIQLPLDMLRNVDARELGPAVFGRNALHRATVRAQCP